jgi:hypothetical protein
MIKLIYYSYKLLKDKVTEGQNIYNIQMDFSTNNSIIKTAKILGFLFFKIIFPLIMKKLDDFITQLQANEDPNSTSFRKIFCINLFKSFDIFLKFCESLNIISFMINNKYPSIWHRVFNIHYVTNILI